MKYKNLFFDLDDTLWACSANARETFQEKYVEFDYGRFFESFDQFYSIYHKRNLELWDEYGKGLVTKEELNRQRFLHPLQVVGVDDPELSKIFSESFFAAIAYKSGVMPHAKEVLGYLEPRYNLYILSNGFQELQYRKMCSAGLDIYFKKIILSDDIGVLKPDPKLFYYALEETGSKLEESLMIGDNWHVDIEGAQNVGMDQAFYNVTGRENLSFNPTFYLEDLLNLKNFL